MKRWILSILALMLLIFLIVVGYLYTDSGKNYVKTQITKSIESATGYSTSVGEFRTNYLSRAVIQNVVIQDSLTEASLTITGIHLDYRLFPLIKGTVHIDSILSDGIDLEFTHTTIQQFIPDTQNSGEAQTWSLNIQYASVQNTTIQYTNHETGLGINLDDLLAEYEKNQTINVQIGNFSGYIQEKSVQNLRVSLLGIYENDQWHIPEFNIQGQSTRSNLTGGVEASENYGPVALKVRGNISEELIEFASGFLPPGFREQINSSDIQVRGALNYSREMLEYTVEVEVDSVSYDTVFASNLNISATGNRDSLHVHRLRMSLGSVNDTLNTNGIVDWKRQSLHLNLVSHLTSLDYVKYFFNTPTTFDSPVNLNFEVVFPFQNVINTRGNGHLIFTDPILGGESLSPIRADFLSTDTTKSVQITQLNNTVEITGNSKYPLEFKGRIQLQQLQRYTEFYGIGNDTRFASQFSGTYSPAEGLNTNGTFYADIQLRQNQLPVSLRAPFQINQTEVEIENGTLAVGDLDPFEIYAGVLFKPELNALIQFREQKSDNTAGGLLQVRVTQDRSLYNASSLIQRFNIAPYVNFFTDQSSLFQGILYGSSQFLVGPDSLSVDGHLNISEISLSNSRSSLDSLTVDFISSDQGVDLQIGYHDENSSRDVVSGYLPFNSSVPIDLAIKTERQDLRFLNPLLPQSWYLSGYVTPEVKVQGTYKTPEFTGQIRIDSSYVQWADNQEPVQDLQGIVQLNERNFQLRKFSFRYLSYPVDIIASGDFSPKIDGEMKVSPEGTIQFSYAHMAGDPGRVSLQNVPFGIFQEYLPSGISGDGTIEAQLSYSKRQNSVYLSTKGNLVTKPDDETEWEMRWDAEYADPRLEIRRFSLSNEREVVSFSGMTEYIQPEILPSEDSENTENDLSGRLVINDFHLTSLKDFFENLNIESGVINTDLDIGGTLEVPAFTGTLNLKEFQWVNDFQDFRIDSGAVLWEFQGRQAELQSLDGYVNEVPVNLSGQVNFDRHYFLDAKFQGRIAENNDIELMLFNDEESDSLKGYIGLKEIEIADIMNLLNDQRRIQGRGSLEMKIAGSRKLPFINLSGLLRDIRIANVNLQRLKILTSYRNNMFHLDTLQFGSQQEYIHGGGTVSGTLDLENFQFKQFGDRLNLNFTANDFPIKSFNEMVSQDLGIAGLLNTSVNFIKNDNESDLSGQLRINNFTSSMPYFEQKISNGEVRANLSGNTIGFETFQFNIGEGVQRVKGSIRVGVGQRPVYNLTLNTEQTRLSHPGEVNMTLAPSKLEVITGANEPTMINGTIRTNSFTYTKPVVNLQLLSLLGSRTIRPERFTEQMLQDIRLNLSIQMIENASVKNNIANIAFNADVQLDGPVFQPRYSGRVSSQSGEIYYLRKTFTIEKAVILLAGRPGLNPDLNISAITTVQAYENVDNIDYEITLDITGSLSNPNVIFAANPSSRPNTTETLSQSDIIGLLAIGRPRPQFASAEENTNFTQTLLRQAKRYTGQQITSAVEYRVKRLLDLDRVTIEGNLFDIAGTQQPVFTAQKTLTDRLSITYSTSIGESNLQGLRVNYRIGKSFYLVTETTQREDTQYGVDLKYKITF